MEHDILLVDDSFFVRKQLTNIIQEADRLNVAETANDGREALEILESETPIDAMVLDVEMPEMDGLEALREMRKRNLSVPVLVVSSLTTEGARETSLALRRGAADVIPKPSRTQSNLDEIGDELVRKLRKIAAPNPERSTSPESSPGDSQPSAKSSSRVSDDKIADVEPEAVLIGGSTGAPSVLRGIVEHLPANFPLPVVIVQHISEPFLSGLVDTLQELTPLNVTQVDRGMRLRAGTIYLPSDEMHLDFRSSADTTYIRPQEGKAVSGAIPSVDCLFDNARDVFGANTINVLLTGMGEDGVRAMEESRRAGALCLGQDRASSTVYGMPGKAEEVGALDQQASDQEIPSVILSWVEKTVGAKELERSRKQVQDIGDAE